MMVPTNRLILFAGLALLPLTIQFLPTEPGGMIALLPILGLVLCCLADAGLGQRQIRSVKVDLSGIIRIARGRETRLGLPVTWGDRAVKYLTLGLAFPPGVFSTTPIVSTALPGENQTIEFYWTIKGIRRGRYLLTDCYLEGGSPMGLWAVRARRRGNCEIRVYPNLFHENRELHTLLLHRGSGVKSVRQIGKGRDFDHLRDYTPGDSYEDIDWKATARFARAVTRVFQIERVQEVYVIVDASRLSGRTVSATVAGRLPDTILDRYVSAALIMCKAIQQQGDLFGIVTFGKSVDRFIRAKSGKSHFDTCRDTLYTLSTESVSPDFDELFTFIGTRLRRRALLMFLTSLDDPLVSEGFTRGVKMARNRHLIMANMVRPQGAVPLFSSQPNDVNDLYNHLGGHILWADLRKMEKSLSHLGVKFNLLESGNFPSQLVSLYHDTKKRQIL
jgi:uncharacterized protein (DUF58 family)